MTNNDTLENRIIEIARKEFVKNGYDCTSMSDIATQVGINRPTLHYYFRTKEKLFQALFKDIVKNIAPEIIPSMISEKTFFEKLSLIIDGYITVFTATPDIPYFIINEIRREPEHLLATAKELQLDQYIKLMEQTLLDEIAAGKLRPVETSIVFTTFYGLISYPFIAGNLIKAIFNYDEVDFLQRWKQNVLSQMKALLCY